MRYSWCSLYYWISNIKQKILQIREPVSKNYYKRKANTCLYQMRELKHYQAESGEKLKMRKHKCAQLAAIKLTQEIRVTLRAYSAPQKQTWIQTRPSASSKTHKVSRCIKNSEAYTRHRQWGKDLREGWGYQPLLDDSSTPILSNFQENQTYSPSPAYIY